MPKRDRVVTVRLTEEERSMLEEVAKSMGVPMAEVLRRMLFHLLLLYQEDLYLDEALADLDELSEVREVLRRMRERGVVVPLYKALKSVPELASLLRRKWSQQQR